MPHTNGLLAWNETDILDLIDSQPGLKWYKTGNWPQLFTPCGCCELNPAGYEHITADEAIHWAQERSNG